MLPSLLALCLLIGMMPTAVFAADDSADNWLNEADTSWYDSGEKNFEIDTAAELAGLAKLVNGGETFAGKSGRRSVQRTPHSRAALMAAATALPV